MIITSYDSSRRVVPGYLLNDIELQLQLPGWACWLIAALVKLAQGITICR